MARLLEVYDEMLKEAELSKMAEEVQFMFAKYAETAESLLKEEYGTEFDVNDVESLARGLMERDSEILEETQKVAEYEEIGRQIAREFAEEVKKEAALGKIIPKDQKFLRNVAAGVTKAVRKTTGLIREYPKAAVGAGIGAGVAAGHMLSGGDN